MTNIRARNLFTAILVARAICGLGIGYAQYTDEGGTSGGGRIIVGSGAGLPDLATYLTEGPSYNDVTLDGTAVSNVTLPFVNTSGDVLGNSLTNQGSVDVNSLGDAGVLFSGDNVSDNTVSNTGTLFGKYGPGLLFEGRTVISDNTVTNSGTLDSKYGPGLLFEGSTVISDNTIVNSGSITAGDATNHSEDNFGIALLAGNDGPETRLANSITGNTITVDASGSIVAYHDGIHLGSTSGSYDTLTTITGNTVVNNGGISSINGHGILFEAGFDNSLNHVTNNGSIRSDETGILLTSLDGNIDGNVIINDVSGNIAGYDNKMASDGIVLNAREGDATDNEVTNRGLINAQYAGVGIYGNGPASGNKVTNESGATIYAGRGIAIYGGSGVTDNTVTNAGDIHASSGYSEVGISLTSDRGAMSGNTVINDVSGNIFSDGSGISLQSGYYSSGDLLDNTVTNNGAIFADYAGIYVGGGHDLSGNAVTNTGGIIGGSGYDSDGIVLSASHDILGNVVTNASTARITVYEDGVVLSASHDVSDNTVDNIGHIANYDGDGIVLYAKNDVLGNTVTNGPRPVGAIDGDANFFDGEINVYDAGISLGSGHDILGNTVTNSGAILSSDGTGIEVNAGNDVSGNTVTNASGARISSSDAGIAVDSDHNITGNTVVNAGEIYVSHYDGIELDARNDLSGNTITNEITGVINAGDDDGMAGYGYNITSNKMANAGTISAQYGMGFWARYDAVTNTVTNTGTISAEDEGIFLGGSRDASGNTVLNAAGALITSGGVGVDLYSYNNTTANTVTNAGQISAEDTGIYLGATNDLSGNTVVNEESPVVLLDAPAGHDDGHITSRDTGIWLWAGENILGNTVTNKGEIMADTVGILLGSELTLKQQDGSGNFVDLISGNTVANASTGEIDVRGGAGILLDGYSVTSNTVTNAGSIDAWYYGGGIAIWGDHDASTNTVVNSGSIDGASSHASGVGIGIGGDDLITGNQVSNTATGRIEVGYEGVGIFLGHEDENTDGIDRMALQAVSGLTGISGNTVDNAGGITAGDQGIGIYIYGSLATVQDNVVTNSGTITVGDGMDQSGNTGGILIGNNARSSKYDGGEPLVSGNVVTNTGGINVGDDACGILIGRELGEPILSMDPNFVAPGGEAEGTLDNRVTNSGTITVGDGGTGVVLADLMTLSGNVVTNTATGHITAGDDGFGVVFSAMTGGDGNQLVNIGDITVGDGGTAVGLYLSGDNLVLNSGTISAGVGGYGVNVSGNGNTVTNWGSISAIPSADPSGNTSTIVINGSDNVLNLEGHSTVNGKITGFGTDSSGNPLNTLNLNFTGLSPEAIAALRADIAAQLAADPDQSEGITFTVRGVTYTVDPMLIDTEGLLSYEGQGGTPNQAALGANLDSLAESPEPGSELFKLLNAVDLSEDVPMALASLSPQRYQLFGDIAVSTMSSVSQQIDHRMAFLSEDMPEKRGNLWISGGYKDATVDGDDRDVTDAKFSTNSVVVGADYRVNPAFTVGALFHYSTTNDAELDNLGSKADVDSRGFGIYAGYRQGGFYGNALAVYSKNDYESKRIVPIPGYTYLAKADTNGHQTGFGIDGGYDFRINEQLTVGPLAGLQWVRLKVDSFEETGALAADLGVDNQTMTSLLGRVGGRLAYSAPVSGNDTFSLDVHAAFQHEFKNDSRDITAVFLGSGLDAFTVKTTDPKRNSVLLGAGFNYDFHGVASVFANYDLQAGSSNWHEHNVKGGVRISF